MEIIHSLSNYNHKENTVVTIGTFDGVHIGHQKIIQRVIKRAKEENFEAVVLTLFPHPRMVLQKDDSINTLKRRIYYFHPIGTPNFDFIVAEGFGNITYASNQVDTDYPTRRTCVIKKNTPSHNIPKTYTACYQTILKSYISLPEINLEYTIKVYPNPTIDNVVLVSDKEQIEQLFVFDTHGKEVKKIDINSKKMSVSIGDLSQGVYVFKIKTANHEIYKRVVKE